MLVSSKKSLATLRSEAMNSQAVRNVKHQEAAFDFLIRLTKGMDD